MIFYLLNFFIKVKFTLKRSSFWHPVKNESYMIIYKNWPHVCYIWFIYWTNMKISLLCMACRSYMLHIYFICETYTSYMIQIWSIYDLCMFQKTKLSKVSYIKHMWFKNRAYMIYIHFINGQFSYVSYTEHLESIYTS